MIDSAFSIGAMHQICEDYAITGMYPLPYLIICDGCSGSPQTDVGARILAHAAANTLGVLYASPEVNDQVVGYEEFGLETIQRAARATQRLHLHLHCLDATLIVCFVVKDTVIIYMYGDGVVVIKQRELNALLSFETQYDNNRPFYLSYRLNEGRYNEYYSTIVGEENGIKNKQEISNVIGEPLDANVRVAFNEPWQTSMPIEEVEFIAIGSDGITQMTNKAGIFQYTPDEIQQLCAFKVTKGQFVKRRLKRFLETRKRQEITNRDDISLAVLYCQED